VFAYIGNEGRNGRVVEPQTDTPKQQLRGLRKKKKRKKKKKKKNILTSPLATVRQISRGGHASEGGVRWCGREWTTLAHDSRTGRGKERGRGFRGRVGQWNESKQKTREA